MRYLTADVEWAGYLSNMSDLPGREAPQARLATKAGRCREGELLVELRTNCFAVRN